MGPADRFLGTLFPPCVVEAREKRREKSNHAVFVVYDKSTPCNHQDRGMSPLGMHRATNAHVIDSRCERIPSILFGEPKKQRPHERVGIRRVVRVA